MEISLTQTIFFVVNAFIKRFLAILFIMMIVYFISQKYPRLGEKYCDSKWTTKSIFLLLSLFIVIRYTLPFVLGGIFYKDFAAFFSQLHGWRSSLAGIIFGCVIFGIIWYVVTRRYKQAFSVLGFSKYNLKSGLVWSIRAFFVFGILGFAALKFFRMGIASPSAELNFLKVFLLIIIAPIVEETIFRGYIYPNFRKKLGMFLAILFTSICFVIIHRMWEEGASVFLRGAILCWLYEKSGSLLPSIIGHATLNLCSILRTYQAGIFIYSTSWLVIWALAGITILIYLLILRYFPSTIKEEVVDAFPSKTEKVAIQNREDVIRKATKKGWTVAIILGLLFFLLYFLGRGQ